MFMWICVDVGVVCDVCVVGDMDTCVLMFMWICVDVGDVDVC